MKRTLTSIFATAVTIAAVLGSQPAMTAAAAGPLNISQIPLFAITSAKPNVLLLFANSNSMDEDPTGQAAGSANATSKSEIARTVAKALVAKYTGVINMGLEAFQQNINGGDQVRLMQLHASPYDASFDPANYDPTWTGNRASPNKKKFRIPNPTNPGAYVYYNVNLPFYDGGNDGTAFCYSQTANAAANAAHPTGFNNGENPVFGPWDGYRCFSQKTNTSDAVPFDGASEAAAGYFNNNGINGGFLPTDSDLGQGITDFGHFLTWNWVSATWFSNGSPGKGFIHIPVANLDATQASKFNTKLGTSQFVQNQPVDPAWPLQNAGLTPLEGSMQTARSYFLGTLAAAEGGPLAAPPNSCGHNYMVILTNGLPSVQANGTPSSDITAMLAAATTATTNLRVNAGVETYVIGFALPFGVDPAQLDTIAAAGGTTTAYNATDQASLAAQLDSVFADILQRSGAASSVAINSASAGAGGYVYQAKFDLGWSGQLNAYPVNANGTLAVAPTWQSAALLDGLNPSTGRHIFTFKPSNRTGIPFRWPANAAAPTATELDPVEINALDADGTGTADARGSARLNFLRGDRSLEGPNTATQFRQRNSVLGDIINSSPIYVGVPDSNLRDVSYAAFRSTVSGRTKMIYVGANDGFLHGFRTTDGVELMAYMPSEVYNNISKLTAQNYSHRYFVDGSPGTGDVKFGTVWHTVLASGLGAGGRSVFALDITDPGAFSSEANASTISLWEYADADLGYTYDTPTLVKLNNGQWGAIFGNGFNNTGTGQSGIYIVNVQTGVLIQKILTGVGSAATPNGIGAARVVDIDGNGTADVVYAGDLTGRMWKFDISDANATNWGVAFGGSPLFTASAGQPITSAPEVTPHPLGGYMVVFGTGQYLATGDPSTTGTQSLYGVRDYANNNIDRTSLVQQTVTSVITLSGNNYRTVSTNAVNWATKNGWYLDLPTSGERLVVDPVLRFGRAVFVTLVPNTDPCSSGGTSWLMEIDYQTGGQPTVRTLDTNNDNTVDVSDTLVGGVQISGGIASSVTVRSLTNNLESKFMNLSSGTILRQLEAGGSLANRRMSWRQER